MTNKIKILFLLIWSLSYFYGSTQILKKNELVLFTDRDCCISGDTVWFKVYVPDTLVSQGDIVRTQLLANGNNLIGSVAGKCENNWAEGFIHIPDSLSSGTCFISAFLNSQRDSAGIELLSKSLIVYNRFEESINEITAPVSSFKVEQKNLNPAIKIVTNKVEYSTREQVSFKLHINSDEISSLVVHAGIFDPLSNETGGYYSHKMISHNPGIPSLIEKNGLFFTGKVLDSDNNPQRQVLVVLSIPGETPYFDYCLSAKDGSFHFFLKNAKGMANLVLQTISKENRAYKIITSNNYIQFAEPVVSQQKILTTTQSDFVKLLIEANYFNKIFNPVLSSSNVGFEMPVRFSIPFYGTPTKRVIPNEFIDLPDFQEISRELLPGVQYRVRKNKVTFRMLNEKAGSFFNNEPLRLINGIPVFKSSLLSSLKSTNIKYIDIVQSERIFGDLAFKGVLAVLLHNNSNSWMAQQPNLFQFNSQCLQFEKHPAYLNKKEINTNNPDMRQNFLWELIQPGAGLSFDFFLSDVKGQLEISVEGVTKNNEAFKASSIVEVK